MKRFLTILLAMILLISAALPLAAGAEGEMQYILSGESGKVGDTVTVTLSVKNAPEIASYMTTLYYDQAVLKPTGQYKKLDMGGMMVINTEAPQVVEGKGTIKVACSTTGKKPVIKGNIDLFKLTFEIIGDCADEKGSLIEVAYHSFSLNDDNLSKVPSLIVKPCRIQVNKADAPAKPAPETPPATDQGTSEENQPAEDEKAPVGDWIISPELGEAVLTEKDENGELKDTLYKIETETDEEGNITGIILFDENDNEVGNLKVEENELGNITVLEQVLDNPNFKEPTPKDFWWLIPIGIALVIAGFGIFYALKLKKED